MGSIAKAMKDALEATGYSELRDYQRKTIEAHLSGKDVFVSAPTGAGKSLTFELATHTRSIDLVGVESGHSAIEVKD